MYKKIFKLAKQLERIAQMQTTETLKSGVVVDILTNAKITNRDGSLIKEYAALLLNYNSIYNKLIEDYNKATDETVQSNIEAKINQMIGHYGIIITVSAGPKLDVIIKTGQLTPDTKLVQLAQQIKTILTPELSKYTFESPVSIELSPNFNIEE